MPADIVFPDKNEKSFIEIAERLGYDRLILAYLSDKEMQASDRRLSEIKTKVRIKKALLVKAPRKAEKGIVLFARSSDNDRQVLESASVDFIYSFEDRKRKDFIHHRNSGLNHIMAKIAADKNIAVAFSFSLVLEASPVERAAIIGRMKQNMILCSKYKTRMIAGSFADSPFKMRSPKDMREFFLLMGMDPSDIRQAQEY